MKTPHLDPILELIKERNAVIEERDQARELNAQLREIADRACRWMRQGGPDDTRMAKLLRAELDQIKEAAK